MKSVSISLLLPAAAIVMLALPGCYPPAPPPPTPAVTLTVNASCNFSSTTVNVIPGDLVRICNDNSCLVTIVFEDRELFGRESVRLSPGECINLHVRRGAAGKTFLADMDCASCGTGGGHGSPEFKVGGGGP